ncbi:MAG TPA: hypothetical protein VFS75_02785 [Candidatus Paceibacterota bacterium]|nr:hypothetical protein [Candidatus Paceibacterota bacterium]
MPKCTEDEQFPCQTCAACELRAKLRPFLDWSGRQPIHTDKARLGNFGPH